MIENIYSTGHRCRQGKNNQSDRASAVTSGAGMGKIGKQRQLNEKIQYRAVRDLSFQETRWILKFKFKHCFMNEIEIF